VTAKRQRGQGEGFALGPFWTGDRASPKYDNISLTPARE
jgi:hypothetical protein